MADNRGGGSHTSHGTIPPSVSNPREDEDEDGPKPQTTSAFAADTPHALMAEGMCPWCDEYDGDHVEQHASSAHPEEWADLTGENDAEDEDAEE